jgi:hypothetical protein
LLGLAKPSVDRALARDPGCKVALLDNSAGSGRLLQFADPARHQIHGVDVHGESLGLLAEAAEAAGFDCEFAEVGMEAIQPRGYGVGLINPPFSIPLSSPLLKPYPCTRFGKFGPGTSAASHEYALHQALDACDVVVAVVGRAYAALVAAGDDALRPRLRAVFHAPPGTFREEGTDVEVSVLVFDREGSMPRPLVVRTLAALPDNPPDLGLSCRSTHGQKPRLGVSAFDDAGPSITLPATGDNRVRVVHDSRRIALKFRCGLAQAKVMNAILKAPVERQNGNEWHRYPKGVKFTGQGVLDVEVHLAQDDPMASFLAFVGDISRAGGEPSVDPGLEGHLRRRIRQKAAQATPFRHVANKPACREQDGQIVGTAKTTHLAEPGIWGAPVVKAGSEVRFSRTEGGKLEFRVGARAFAVSEDAARLRFDLSAAPEGKPADDWRVLFPGRVAMFKSRADALRKRAGALGLASWLWDFQLEDVCESLLSPTGNIVAWSVGLGKARMCAALILLSGVRHGLVAVEAHLVPEMVRELESLPIARDAWKVLGSPADFKTLATINIASYNRLRSPVDPARPKRTCAKALRRRFALVVADEGHLLRNPDTAQSRALYALSAKKRFVSTATPQANYPRDLLALAAFAGGDGTAAQPYGWHRGFMEPRLRQSMGFVPRGIDRFAADFVTLEWCTNQFAESLQAGAKREVPKIQNLDAYRAWIAPHLKRRVPQEPDVARYISVPEPVKTVATLAWDEAHLKFYLDVAEDFRSWFMRQRGGKGEHSSLAALLAPIQAVQQALNFPQGGVQGFGAFHALTSKQRHVLDRLAQNTAEGHKTILFLDSPGGAELIARHLEARGVGAVVLHGGIPVPERTRLLDSRFRFGGCPNLIATLGTTQTGLNIPQASRAIFLNRSWTAKAEDQALGRLLRPQQKCRVQCEFVHVEGSLDVYQAQMVGHKGDTARAGLDWATPEMDGVEFLHMDTLLGRFAEDLAKLRGCGRHELRKRLAAA